jgi:hypothetical protein
MRLTPDAQFSGYQIGSPAQYEYKEHHWFLIELYHLVWCKKYLGVVTWHTTDHHKILLNSFDRNSPVAAKRNA